MYEMQPEEELRLLMVGWVSFKGCSWEMRLLDYGDGTKRLTNVGIVREMNIFA